jgi:hypothetical protein
MTPGKQTNGYLRVGLYKGRKVKYFTVHRLVALAFLPCIGEQVNHKDLNKENNDVSNLEWISRRENQKHYQQKMGHTGVGVCFNKQAKKWRATYQQSGKKHYIGSYATRNEALKARAEYEANL